MIHRIELSPLDDWRDAKAEAVKKQIKEILKLPIQNIKTREVYTVSANASKQEMLKVANELQNPVIQKAELEVSSVSGYDWLIIVGFLPGVTDNLGHTAFLAIGDILGRKLDSKSEKVFSSTEYFLTAPKLKKSDVERIGKKILANELIQSVTVLSKDEVNASGIPQNIPAVKDIAIETVKEINFNVSDN